MEIEVGTDNDPDRIRYGCFLPDLTGLASVPSTAGSRGGYRTGFVRMRVVLWIEPVGRISWVRKDVWL